MATLWQAGLSPGRGNAKRGHESVYVGSDEAAAARTGSAGRSSGVDGAMDYLL